MGTAESSVKPSSSPRAACGMREIPSPSPNKSSPSRLPESPHPTRANGVGGRSHLPLPGPPRGPQGRSRRLHRPHPRAGVATTCLPARSQGFAARGTDQRLAIHVASRCRAASAGHGTRTAANTAKKSGRPKGVTPKFSLAPLYQASAIPDGWIGLDIGPDSVAAFSSALETTQTVIWNGPMGVFEFEKFAVGTEAIAKKLAELSGKGVTTIIGGGDSVAAVEKNN
ncbi:hypothetical protein E2562_030957 [Oryza meyeriana var. granulata]|uniref:Phosphoglycerate kinase n=1 Tax=Oryza meyeriana var. granulata TaxID=110450 RepID=A0A6G1E4K5_9ORYZ|nr:hypothetical protein E2562_030957 [Oryza meyeriana var. granulata]